MADKIVKLVDKNSNNLYPVAGSVIDNAVSTGAISSQAVNNAKIENGAVNGVENNATAIGTAKLALDTVGTPNLRDASVTSDKIDFTTIKDQANGLPIAYIRSSIGYGVMAHFYRAGNLVYVSTVYTPITIPRCEATTLLETIPEGYRPAQLGNIIGSGMMSSSNGLGWITYNDGKIEFWTDGITNAGVAVSGMWFTNDAWPS